MKPWIAREIERTRLTKTSAAVSGITGAAAAVTGAIANAAAPSGLSALAVWIGIASPPLVVVAAPYVIGVGAAVATFAGTMRFYNWCHERLEEEKGSGAFTKDSKGEEPQE